MNIKVNIAKLWGSSAVIGIIAVMTNPEFTAENLIYFIMGSMLLYLLTATKLYDE